MGLTVTQVINQAAMNRLLRSPQGGVARDMLKRGARVAAAAKRMAPKASGALAGSIQVKPYLLAGEFGVEVGTDEPYALDVMKGTGIYGPRGAPITPKNGTYLVFKGKRSGGIVFAKSVRGQKAKPFLEKALKAAYRL